MKGGNFLLKNLLKGFAWLAVIIGVFILIKQNVNDDSYAWFEPIYTNAVLIYFIFLISEIVFGIIPPELFMIWAATKFELITFIFNIAFLSILSYLAGVLGFGIGVFLNKSLFFSVSKKRILGKYEKYLLEYGAFMVIVAAVTPVPFSGISMLVGSVDLPFRRYLIFSLFRFLRFIIYAFIVWEANVIY